MHARLLLCLLLWPGWALAQTLPSSQPDSLIAAAPFVIWYRLWASPGVDPFVEVGVTEGGEAWKIYADGRQEGPYASLQALLKELHLYDNDLTRRRTNPHPEIPGSACAGASDCKAKEAEGARLFAIWRREADSPLSYAATQKKSPAAAFLLSTGGLLVAPAMYAIGLGKEGFSGIINEDPLRKARVYTMTTLSISFLIAGPSLGHLYLGDSQHLARLSLRRALSIGGVLASLSSLFFIALADFSLLGPSNISPGQKTVGVVSIFFGSASLVTAGVYCFGDIANSIKAARRHNQEGMPKN